ncbi:MAG: hypothetical protein LQ345_005344 [Seirophora villosa]|nr:MAG: hypothetical protein LQ345_005344 [Seirophora villosa]
MPPPLAREPPPQLERNGPSLPTPSSASASAPPLSSVPTSSEEPPSTSSVMNGKKYSLEIAQQPVRARMCGFGDKDRRPITPPPCIRLVVRDANPPHNEVDMNQIEIGFLVLTVDLWDVDGKKEVNLVKHSQTSPSISAATAASYPPPNTLQNPFNLPNQYMPGPPFHSAPPQHQMLHQQQMYAAPSLGYHTHPYQQQQHQQQQQQPMYHHQQHQIAPPPIHTQHQQQQYYTTPSGTPITPSAYYGSQFQGPPPLHLCHTPTDPTGSMPTPPGMFTRNLIGSLGVSAFKLTDNDNNMGIWFILQDLSVRTEGSFRLKMSFVNVGSPTGGASPNSGSAPVLASCFSQPFQVFSAKKFPGVIESTPLSKCFATQGIKIPIRKDAPRGNMRGDDDEDG